MNETELVVLTGGPGTNLTMLTRQNENLDHPGDGRCCTLRPGRLRCSITRTREDEDPFGFASDQTCPLRAWLRTARLRWTWAKARALAGAQATDPGENGRRKFYPRVGV